MLAAPSLRPPAYANVGFGATQFQSTLSLPTATRTVPVANQSEFNAAYAAAIPGDHIVLADGAYTAPNSGSWTKSGTETNPIVIRSAKLLGARIGNININASDVTLYGIDFVNAMVKVANTSASARAKIWRCRFRDRPVMARGEGIDMVGPATFTDIAYCEWVNWGGIGLRISPANGATDWTIRRCLFRDQAGNNQLANATEAMQLGRTWTDRIDCRGLVEENRIVNWSRDDEAISVKTNGLTVRRNTLENCRGSLQNRLGFNNRYEANWIKNGGGYVNHDGPNLYLGNRHEGTTGGWQAFSIFMGNVEAQASPLPSNGFNRSRDCVVSGNVADNTTFIGRNYSSGFLNLSADGTRIRQHTGTVSVLAGARNTNNQPGTNENLYTWVDRVWLENADVGPQANNIETSEQSVDSRHNQSDSTSANSSVNQGQTQGTGNSDNHTSQNPQSQNMPGDSGSNTADGCAIDTTRQPQAPGQNSSTNVVSAQCNPDIDVALGQHQGENAWNVATIYRRKAHENFLQMSKYSAGSEPFKQHYNMYRTCEAIHNRAREIASSTGIIK